MNSKDPRLRPIYTVRDASKYLQVPQNTLRAWAFGRAFPTKEGSTFAKPVIQSADPDNRMLSFLNLLELHVLAAMRRRHHVDMRQVRRAVRYLQDRLGHDRPLIDVSMETNGTDLFVDHLGQLVAVSRDGQLAMGDLLRLYLHRIERDGTGTPVRLFPFTRRPPEQEADDAVDVRLIVIDARVAFGRPVLANSRIPTQEIAERYKAGDSTEALAEDYGRTVAEIEEAIRCELTPAA
jgi:uncharacterized protein (DUF433 family)